MKKKSRTKTIYDEVEQYCKVEWRARYLKNRDRAIVNVLLTHFPSMACIEKERLITFISSAQSYARGFRKVLEDHPEWTNEQEKFEKHVLEEKMELELGYKPGLNEDLEKLKTL